MNNSPHTFHIPVMGIGYTLTSPVKVAQYGISSVVSLVDDILIEKMRKHLSNKFDKSYSEISNKVEDFRAKRITAYLNMLNDIINDQVAKIKQTPFLRKSEITKYFEMLPKSSNLRMKYEEMKETLNAYNMVEMQDKLKEKVTPGFIDVNIMTKLDKPNYINNDIQLEQKYNDAHAALRGYANSDVCSSIVLSAGMNPRLYSYISEFDDFFPNEEGVIKKKVILKVSDYRSALIQGKFLAKKGIWVSEFRIESGLNCGGHAFATDGYLMGPILKEFDSNRNELTESLFEIYQAALKSQERFVPEKAPELSLSAQGGVGTADEHEFLMKNYHLNSVGWGTPFLFVPEAVEIDKDTLELICDAEEPDFYTSDTSPLGVLFNSVKGNTKDGEKEINIKKNRPGSSCPKKYASLNTEFTDQPICIASREYQFKKIKDLESKDLAPKVLQAQVDDVMEKSCICVGLGTTALLANDLDTKVEGKGVSICPGPNGAYFKEEKTLHEMTDQIYGATESFIKEGRPDMFAKELMMYMDHFRKVRLKESMPLKKLQAFRDNLFLGIEYYDNMIQGMNKKSKHTFEKLQRKIRESSDELMTISFSTPA